MFVSGRFGLLVPGSGVQELADEGLKQCSVCRF